MVFVMSGHPHKMGHLFSRCSAGSRPASLIAASLLKSGTAFRSTSVPSYVGGLMSLTGCCTEKSLIFIMEHFSCNLRGAPEKIAQALIVRFLAAVEKGAGIIVVQIRKPKPEIALIFGKSSHEAERVPDALQ